MMDRRSLVVGAAGVGALLAAGCGGRSAKAADRVFEVTHTDQEWRTLLSPAAYQVLRHEATEPPGSSPLDHEKRKGVFDCAGCDLPLYESSTKFDSGTGWPSFYRPLPKAVISTTDRTLGMARTAISCRRCGGHLGHVFNDGPPPTGQRYCMNGLALKFVPA